MKFIKLIGNVINISHISNITIINNSYYLIHMNNYQTKGFFLTICGFITSQNDIFHICKEKQPDDYNTITKFINDSNYIVK